MERHRRAALVSLGSLGAALLLSLFVVRWINRAAPPREPARVPTAPESVLPTSTPPERGASSVFGEWIALGSGCRATSKEPGDIALERLRVNMAGKDIHRARFHLDSFRLTGADRPSGASKSFARECAIRLQILPPTGKRIANVTARTSVVSSKPADLGLTLSAQLRLGAAAIGHRTIVYDAPSAHHDRVDLFNLSPGVPADEVLPSVACGEAKLIGFDYTWIAEPVGDDEVAVELGEAKVLDLDAELVECS